jgi:RNA polymerase sigma factor (sigma-70 family)
LLKQSESSAYAVYLLYIYAVNQATMTEAEVLDGCIRKNAVAQDALYQRFSPRMFGVCYRFARNRQDAEDMLQEGFIKVYTQIGQFRNEGSLEGWIRRIIVHTCINILKRNRKFAETLDIADVAEQIRVKEEAAGSYFEVRQIVETIRTLPLGYRTVLNLYAIEGYSHKEIGAMLDIGESTSRSQYTRAKAMLEELLVKKQIIKKNVTNGRLYG